MNSLFGLSMDTIMAWMLSIFLIITAIVAVLGLRNRLLVKLGVRNIPRRRAQTILIIVGLMLSTVIITSAFGTGDTVSYSVRSIAVNSLGTIDETVSSAAGGANSSFNGASSASTYLPVPVVQRIVSAASTNKNVDGVVPIALQGAP